jgi:hypothetical protein
VAQGRLVAVCATRHPDGSMKSVPLPGAFADQLQEAPAELLAHNVTSFKQQGMLSTTPRQLLPQSGRRPASP